MGQSIQAGATYMKLRGNNEGQNDGKKGRYQGNLQGVEETPKGCDPKWTNREGKTGRQNGKDYRDNRGPDQILQWRAGHRLIQREKVKK